MRDLNLPNTGPEAIVVVKDTEGHLKDLSHVPETDAEFLPIPANTAEGRAVIRHSCTHVLAQAVQQEFPGTKLGIGPAIDNGFYYDFDVAEPFTPEDLQRIEKRMKKIIKQGQKFERRVYADQAEAAEALKNEPYKLELIADKGSVDPQSDEATEVGAGELTGYYNLNPRTKAVEWYDLCRGPHVPTTKYIPAFALTRSSAAYWRGDQANAGLQRIYGTAWESPDALAEYQHKMAEAEKTRPPAARPRTRPVLLPRRNRLRIPRIPPERRHCAPRNGRTLPTPPHRGRLLLRQHPTPDQG